VTMFRETPVLQLLERLDDSGKRRPFQGRKLLDPRTATLKQLPIHRARMLGRMLREGIGGALARRGFHGRVSTVGSTAS